MARKTDTVLGTEKDTTFANGSNITAAELRAHVQDMIDSKANLDVTDTLNSGKAAAVHTHTVSDITDLTEVTGTEGQRSGFGSGGEEAAFNDIRVPQVNMDGETSGATAVAEIVLNYNCTINACTGKTTGAGSTINLAIAIDGTPVTGLTAVALDETLAGNRDASSGASSYTAGSVITITKSGATGSPTRVLAVLEVTPTSLPAALS